MNRPKRGDRKVGPKQVAGPKHRYAALDGWRGLCACLVALFHFRAPGSSGLVTDSHLTSNPVVASAWLFTDFFFVLSGFVIAANYRDRLSRGESPWRFLSLRLARVWPLHVVMLLVLALVIRTAQLATEARAGTRIPMFFQGANSGGPFISNLFLVHAWHIHPLGQTLIVTAGCGRAQREGGPIEEIRPGDVVWFPPNEKHWHGAAPTTAMTHIAIQEQLDGKAVEWMQKVSDEEYRG